MIVMVWDESRPQKTATSTFTAIIARNEYAPRWNQSEWRKTISDRYKLGQKIIRIGATDRDGVKYITISK